MKKWTFTTQIFAGDDALSRLDELVSERIFLVCDAFMIGSPLLENLLSRLQVANKITLYTDVRPDPPISDVAKGVEALRAADPTLVIAIGGGSAIDLTKGIQYFARKGGFVSRLRFIAIPTTSGTGSEVTSFAVITDEVTKVKYPIYDQSMLPNEAILTPEFVLTSPPSVTAFSGMDVLAHAIESYVATKADLFSEALSEKAIEVVFSTLPTCVHDGKNRTARQTMHEASCMAGLSFNRVGLGMMHAIAHQLGAQFHVPHGLANAMVMRGVIAANAAHCDVAKRKYAKVFTRLQQQATGTDEEKVLALQAVIGAMMDIIKCPKTLTAFGVQPEDVHARIPSIIDAALKDMTLTTNPYQPSRTDIEQIILSII